MRMKHFLLILLFTVLASLFMAPISRAVEFSTSNSPIITSEIKDDLLTAGDSILINAPISGDVLAVGNGVTVEATYVMREFLNSIGAKNVKIVVSSGFNRNKVKAFREAGAPMDFIGTGSWLKFTMFTADISDVWENGAWKPRLKVGRIHNNGLRAKVLFERK